jgi:hypothetical protein
MRIKERAIPNLASLSDSFRDVTMDLSLLTLILGIAILAPDDTSEQAHCLRLLKENWHGVYSEIESVIPESSANEPEQLKIWTSPNGVFSRINSTMDFVTQKGKKGAIERWAVLGEEYYLMRIKSDFEDVEPTYTYSGRVAGVVGSPMSPETVFSPIECFFGLDGFTGVYWYEVLESPSTNISTKQVNGGIEVIAKHKAYGDFQFWFEKSSDVWLLRSVTCKKNNVSPVREKGNLTGYSYEVSNIEYKDFGGRNFIESFTLRKDFRSKSSPERKVVFQQRMKAISMNEDLVDDRIVFPGVTIADGTTVKIRNDVGIPYEIHGGVLARVVDSSAIVTGENARFRTPPTVSWLYYPGLMLVVAAAFVAIWYWRRT